VVEERETEEGAEYNLESLNKKYLCLSNCYCKRW
jgi:hypothetical protein